MSIIMINTRAYTTDCEQLNCHHTITIYIHVPVHVHTRVVL